jgi:lipopolysaccharide/colanic/teichoic acid biosynthesis glycosyltransferase
MHLDMWYIDTWSRLLDTKILARTIFAVLKRSGAAKGTKRLGVGE